MHKKLNDDEKDLRKAFHRLEKKYRPFVDFLVENQEFYPEFKGAFTIDGFLVHKPKLLILSYNPGKGKYKEYKKDGAHLSQYGERPTGVFEWGNARKNGNWWEVDKVVNNTFPANIIEFLYAYTCSKRGSKDNIKKIENEIMFLNLYPVATKNIDSFKKMLSRLLKDEKFRKSDCFKDKWECEWDIRDYWRGKIRKFIDTYIKPEKIICLGKSTIEDYLWDKKHIKIIEDGIFCSKDNRHIYGISRRGCWCERARSVAKIIAK